MTDARIDTTPVRAFPCPVCARLCDAVTGAGLDTAAVIRPKDGDLIICAYCHAVLVFGPVGMRIATQAECDDLPPLALQYLAFVERAR
jgi:hypothetical protein